MKRGENNNSKLITKVISFLASKYEQYQWIGWQRITGVGCQTMHPNGLIITIRLYHPSHHMFPNYPLTEKSRKFIDYDENFDPDKHVHWYILEITDMFYRFGKKYVLRLEVEHDEKFYNELRDLFNKIDKVANFNALDEKKPTSFTLEGVINLLK